MLRSRKSDVVQRAAASGPWMREQMEKCVLPRSTSAHVRPRKVSYLSADMPVAVVGVMISKALIAVPPTTDKRPFSVVHIGEW